MKFQPYWIILIVMMAFYSPSSYGQFRIAGKSLLELREKKAVLDIKPFYLPSPAHFSIQKPLPDYIDITPQYSISNIPNIYSYDELGMFCKFDVQLEKATRFPVKFRLGEVEAVDRKEGKWQFDNWN